MQTKTFFPFSKTLIFSLLFLFPFCRTFAQAPPARQSAFDLLTAEEGAAITLELDLTDLINNKNTNNYYPGTLSTASGQMLKVEVRARGKFRRRVCDVPPLKLKFPKKELKAANLDTLNEMKMVVPCFDDPRGQELLLREYVAYRMFERLSPNSVRARLVTVTFRDRHVEGVKTPVYCLLVEHEEQVAARLHGRIEEIYSTPADSLQTEQAALTAVFNYMIGNTDWGVADNRNVYLLRAAPGEKLAVVPYDFDFAGLVDAPYTVPKAETGMKYIRERKLQTQGIPEPALRQAAAKIKGAQGDLLAWCNSSFLSKNTAKEMTRYLESFFEKADQLPVEQGRPKGSLR